MHGTPDAANPPKTNVQNAAAKTARKVNDATIAHLIATWSLGNRIASEAAMTGSGCVIGLDPLVEGGGRKLRPTCGTN